ncbi:MAG: B12-binding domain-containing radical SAM protein [Deltaproteobacteria bacterium]|jgi:radical SAM superfamily enzyme YgiQ (UPF0313 family)|nr:B12-binding domain-containing radical SAM protein [Deltaproteobacteria bacterium]
MKVTFIKPRIGTGIDSLYIEEGRMEPLTIAVLASLTPDDFEIKFYDDRIEEIPYDEATDLVAITVETWTARRSYQISNEFRKRGVKVIMGGFHPTLAPNEVAQYCDSVFTGDAEWKWHEVLEDLKNKNLKSIYHSKPGIAQKSRILPRRDIFENKNYLPITLMQFSRGCHFSCNFCAISKFFDKKQFHREIDDVLLELEKRKHKLVFFVDDNFCANRKLAKEMCQAMIPLKLKWVSQASIDMTLDKDLMSSMAKSGCMGHVIGFESISEFELIKMKKSHPNLSKYNNPTYQDQIEILRDYGLQTWASFTFGYDSDTLDTIKRTVDFAIANKFCFGAFNILKPYPNTALYNSLNEQHRLLWDGKWWNHPNYQFNHSTFIPKQMSPDELTVALDEARKLWSSPLVMIKRYLDPKTHMSSLFRSIIYWTYNPIYGRENRRKQGIKFGLKEQ